MFKAVPCLGGSSLSGLFVTIGALAAIVTCIVMLVHAIVTAIELKSSDFRQ